jgi:6,7-dimethyl-8-ribityllumazine synthase
MPTILQGELAGRGQRFAIAVSRFNEAVTLRLLHGATEALRRHGVAGDDVTIAFVPGALELPLLAQELAASGRFAAVLCLGCVIRGETPHFDYVCSESARGMTDVALATGVPVLNGVLTCNTADQARARAGDDGGNKGVEVAHAALEMASLIASVAGDGRGGRRSPRRRATSGSARRT